jgi:hypothetical protein
MTSKLFVIINSLKYQKLRKCYYMKWNFLYQITAASRTHDYGATAPRFRSLCPLSSTEFVEPPPNRIPGYATDQREEEWDTKQMTNNVTNHIGNSMIEDISKFQTTRRYTPVALSAASSSNNSLVGCYGFLYEWNSIERKEERNTGQMKGEKEGMKGFPVLIVA